MVWIPSALVEQSKAGGDKKDIFQYNVSVQPTN